MNEETRAMLDLCRASFLGQASPPLKAGVDYLAVINLAQKNMVASLVVRALLQSNALPERVRCAAKACLDTARYFEAVQYFECAELMRRFSEQGIDYCPLKGWYWRALYPTAYDREMHDVDVLVRLPCWMDACRAACEQGFERDDEGEIDTHSVLYKGDVKLEMHRTLFSSHGLNEGGDRKIFETLMPGSAPHEWRMTPTEDYLYFFLHTEKHIASYGFDLRMLTDLYALNVQGPKIDRARFEREAKRLRINRLARNLEALALDWMAGKALAPARMRALDFLLGLDDLTETEQNYRTARRWLRLNMTLPGLFRRLFVPRALLYTRFEGAASQAEAERANRLRAKKAYRYYLGKYFSGVRRLPAARRRALNRAARALYTCAL